MIENESLTLKASYRLRWSLGLLEQHHPLPHLSPLDPLQRESDCLTRLGVVDVDPLTLNRLDTDGEEGIDRVGTEEGNVVGPAGLRGG